MQTQAPAYRSFHQSRSAKAGLLSLSMLLTLVALFVSSGQTPKAHAQSTCASGDQVYIVANGDNLSGIAANYSMSWQSLASYNGIADSNQIYPGGIICIPGAAPAQSGTGAGGAYNSYPYGQCTWWANQRYHQLHGVYVPWLYGSDARYWTARAYQYGWHVSNTPTIGAIIDLQPWVQGAHEMGHVAIVERILANGDVIASNMNWGTYPGSVAYVEFAPDSGVTFITN